MKVWLVGSKDAGFRLVAAMSQKEAANLLRVQVATLRDFGKVTDDPELIQTAMQAPGTVYATQGRRPGVPDDTFRPETSQ
jgi:hypothetical protein